MRCAASVPIQMPATAHVHCHHMPCARPCPVSFLLVAQLAPFRRSLSAFAAAAAVLPARRAMTSRPPQSAFNNPAMAAAVNNSPFTIREGKAVIQRPPKEGTLTTADAAPAASAAAAPAAAVAGPDGIAEVEGEGLQEVFYNKVQVFNRDLSILMIQTFVDERKDEWAARLDSQREKEKRRAAAKAAQTAVTAAAPAAPEAASTPAPASSPAPAADSEAAGAAEPFPGIQILEALSATGLRSIRYFREISDVRSIIVNDMDAEAVKSIEHNILLNGLTTQQLQPSHSDAITLMQKFRPPVMGPIVHERPQVIDLSATHNAGGANATRKWDGYRGMQWTETHRSLTFSCVVLLIIVQ